MVLKEDCQLELLFLEKWLPTKANGFERGLPLLFFEKWLPTKVISIKKDCQLEFFIWSKDCQLELKFKAKKWAGNSNLLTLNAHSSFAGKFGQAIFSI